MKVEFSKNIFKDFDKIDDELLLKVNNLVLELQELEIFSLKNYNIKKMKWFKNYYRIRFWDFRLGLKVDDEKVVLLTVKHRKDIYKSFP